MDVSGGSGPREENEVILATLAKAVDALHGAVPAGVEVVLHDIGALPESIVALAGHVTGRVVGDPATDLLLEMAVRGRYETVTDYVAQHPTAGTLRCTTTVIRNSADEPVAVLCVNRAVAFWQALADAAASMLEPGAPTPTEPLGVALPPRPAATEAAPSNERFARSVSELADHVLEAAILRTGKRVSHMRKADKVDVVRELQARGFFLLRDSVETAAQALGVSRFTVYNYLNEIEEADGPAVQP
ncbi:transcriptional regulator [Propioniciclava coleopterorum]|uniref:Transcriptional regulator n=1 Tax=Propioniciclava coleopterorum TaxID=2714937 RepID=A0A6G7Y5S7_9ACTN|nr:PAS domain-containing protein [Propioniciclava coleopterorum]QIK71998.1 transcriptional regulator [Propioniciclava coleopterorum]